MRSAQLTSSKATPAIDWLATSVWMVIALLTAVFVYGLATLF